MAQGKIRKYKKPANINIGMIIFSIIFIYVLVCVFMYFRSGHIVRYEVKEGSLVTNNIYRGVILRDETVETQVTGYVNYYAREEQRVGKNDLVYIMDESGRLSETLASLNMGENSLSDKELAGFRNDLVNFTHRFDANHFDSIYDFKFLLKNSILKMSSNNMLESIANISGMPGVNIVNYSYAPDTGCVAYWTDGYEELKPEDINTEIFDEKSYSRKSLVSNSLVAAGDAVYKISTNENWSIVIPVDPVRGAQLLEEGYVLVRFLKNQYESWGKVDLLYNGDGNTYLKLEFTNSMITFLSERFLDIELIVEDETGLKIPLTSIVEKEFFLIPEEFIIPGGNNEGYSVIRRTLMEDGTISSEFITVDIYNYDSSTKEYYLDGSILNIGDILFKLDSQEIFTVSKRATLIGVYNMNKGYADFKQINILYQNDEYAIVKSNTKYGLNVYDYIVLNADEVSDDQFINQ